MTLAGSGPPIQVYLLQTKGSPAMWFVTTVLLGRASPVHPFQATGGGMADATGLRIRVTDALKSEWQARARADGTNLSQLVRISARLGILLGPARLKDAVADISAMRRDLHAVAAYLNKLAQQSAAADPEQLRAALASAHKAAEATSAFLRRR